MKKGLGRRKEKRKSRETKGGWWKDDEMEEQNVGEIREEGEQRERQRDRQARKKSVALVPESWILKP